MWGADVGPGLGWLEWGYCFCWTLSILLLLYFAQLYLSITLVFENVFSLWLGALRRASELSSRKLPISPVLRDQWLPPSTVCPDYVPHSSPLPGPN